MIKCFPSDLEACLAHLKFPADHQRYIRTTNLIERAFVEEYFNFRVTGKFDYLNPTGQLLKYRPVASIF